MSSLSQFIKRLSASSVTGLWLVILTQSALLAPLAATSLAQTSSPGDLMSAFPGDLMSGLELSSPATSAHQPSGDAAASVASPYKSPSTSGLTHTVDINRTRVVLLKNDRCLTGRVRQLGDQVEIEIDESARVTKPTREIETIADDLEAIYRYKLSRFSRLGPGENIRMARWSMTHGLLQHASHHYLAVQQIAANEPIVKQLGIELREQLLKDEEFRAYLGLPSLASAAVEAIAPVRTASAGSEPLAPILPAVQVSFTDHVQPILLKRCSQAGCHGTSSTNRMKFVQPAGNSRARLSEQNCRSVMPFVEVDDSNMSILLHYALVAHGMQKSPAITAQETKLLETLQSWTTFARNPVVAAVDYSSAPLPGAGPTAVNQTAPAVYNSTNSPAKLPGAKLPGTSPASTTPNSLSPIPLAPLAPGASQLNGVLPTMPGSIRSGAGAGISPSELDELDDQVRRALGEPPRGAAGDPFDPTEFNRRRAGK